MYSTVGFAGVGVAIMPYLMYTIHRLRKIKNSQQKLAFGVGTQILCIACSLMTAKKLEEIEHKCIERYLVDYLVYGNQLVYIEAMKSTNHT